jgi:predicted nucleic acid-binding Zn ribbon protein
LSPDRDLEHFSESVAEMFTRLGLPDPVVMAGVSSEWEELAGPPWSGRSRPLYMKGTTLVVEAVSPSMIAFLKYGETELLRRLSERFGDGVVASIEIKAPGRG